MTGDRNKTRVIVSQRLISPLSCCNNFNSKAIEFRSSVVQSLSTSRLNADIAVKTAMGAKPTYEDTDNKKREFTGTTKPGVNEIAPGMRVESNQAWEEGRSLVLYPSWKSKRSMSLDANFGWIKDTPDTDFETAQKIRNSKPQIQFTKYDVSKKTGDVIPESETEIDMVYPSLGLSRAQRLKRDNYISNPQMQFKMLPGRPLSSRVPGGNLLDRAAGRFGISRDANNKFRCPPGTPAANQFTDHLGSNCFGFAAERAAKFIADKIGAMMRTEEGETLSLASGAKSTWADKVRERLGGGLPGRSPSYDGSTGERIPTPDARAIDVPGKMRWFKNATINAQEKLRRSENTVNKLGERLGLRRDYTPKEIEANQDRWEAFQKLQSSGLWDLKITGRLNPEQVNSLVVSRLQRVPEFMRMGQRDRDALIAADTKRYYETERAFLDTALEQYALRPEHMRTVGEINFRNASLEDGAEANTQWVPSSKGSDIKSVINVHIPTVMSNQEQLIPNLSPSERLVISAVGATTDAAATAEIADFLVNTEYTARGMAGLIDGPRSFARHIMIHEIGHTIQGEAFLNAVKRQLDATGKIQVPKIKNGKLSSEMKEVTDFKKLTGGDLAALVISSQDDINVGSLDESLSKLENVAFLAGSYPNVAKSQGRTEVYALEATAELFALREEGIIFGDDVDEALRFMDDAIGEGVSEARAVSDAEIFERLEESYFSPMERGEDVLPIRKHLRSGIELDPKAIAAKKEERILDGWKERLGEANQEELAVELADIIENKDIMENALKDAIAARKSIESSDFSDEEKAKELADIDAIIVDIEENVKLANKIEELAIKANKSFNTDGKKASDAEIRKMAKEILDKRPPATPREAARRISAARTDGLRAEAEALDEKSLMKTIADYDLKASSLKPDSDEYITAIADREIFVQQYIANKKAAGDTRTSNAIRNELKREITKEITAARKAVDEAKRGKLKPQKMKSKEQIAQNAKKERAKHRRNITKQQFEAVKEIDDFNTAEITQMLEPDKQVAIGRAINKRNNRLKRLGLESDPSSVDEGSLDEQVENILIPAMEAIDASDITTPFEMEVFIDSSKLSRIKPGKEIDVESFGQGKVLSRSMKSGKPEKGSKKKRVVVQVKEGDRGLFPLAKKGDDQQFVIPPGKLRVVGRDKDGSLIVEISSQKDTVDVLDDLSKSIGDGPGDAIWRQGAKKKVQLVADRHAVKRKDDAVGTKSDDAAKVTETSESIVAEVSELGGEFGETSSMGLSSGATEKPSGDGIMSILFPSAKDMTDEQLLQQLFDVDSNFGRGPFGRGVDSFGRRDFAAEERRDRERIREIRYELSTRGISASEIKKRSPLIGRSNTSLSSGAKDTTESLRTKRHEKYSEVIGKPGERSESLKSSIAALMDEDRNLAASVEEILDNESNEQIIDRIETAAQKLHSGFDRRVRVRMNEEDIGEFAETGKIRATRNTGSSAASGVSRRTERLSLSSGEEKKSRKESEQEFAQKVKERIKEKLSKIPPPKLDEGMDKKERGEAIRKNVDNWFDNMSDAELGELGARRFYDLDGNPIVSKTTGRIIYQTENNEVAASMLSLGQTVEMPEHKRGESLMVKQAANQIKKALKELAKENPGQIVTADLCKFYLEGKNVFCSKNLKVDRLDMPQVGGRAIDNESMSLRLWGSGLATAETAQAHAAGEDGKLTTGLRAQLDTLRKEGKTIEAEELEKDIKALEWIGLGFEGAGVEQKDITPEQQQLMDKYGIDITGRELKRLGEKWNRAATARMEGREPDPSDEFSPKERENFFSPSNLDYSMLEPDGVDAFTNFLKMLGVGVQEDRVTKPDELMASQRELDGPKVDGISENILSAVQRIADITDPAERKKEVERLRRENGLFKKILISKEGYIVDGHHRIIGKVVTNGVLSEDMPGLDQDDLDLLGLPVRQIDMGIIELLTVSRVYQDFLGIKAASLSASDDDSFKTAGVVGKASKKLITDAEDMHGIDKIPKITQQEFDAAHEELLSQIQEKTDEIYERGQFIQVDSVGLNDTEQSTMYKESELLRQTESTARNKGRKVAKETELSLASGATTDSKTGRSIGKNRGKKEDVKKDAAAEWFSSFKGIDSPDFGKNKDGYERTKRYYESVGLNGDIREDLMPVSGYLVHKSHIQKKKNDVIKNRVGNVGPDAVFEVQDNDPVGDGLTSLGDVEIVLKPEVSKRTSYGRGTGVKNGHRPVSMSSTSKDDISHAVSYSGSDSDSDAMVNLLASSVDGDFSRMSRNSKTKSNENFEAHILGGFDADEVDSINYPYSKLSKLSQKEDISDVVNDESIADSLRDMGFTQAEIDYFYSVGGPGQINTESMAKLREYRMSKKVKDKYSKLGFSKVKIAHPQGLNIENPRTHSKASRGIEDVETLLKKEIAAEIKKTVDELLKQMRKGQKPRVVSKVGSGI